MGEVAKRDAPHNGEDWSRMGQWMHAQTTNLDVVRREAAEHIRSRWDITSPWFNLTRILRTLQREESPHLVGARMLAADYEAQFPETAAKIGLVGMIPIEVVYCAKCRREAVPGSEFCGRHGGQFLSPEAAQAISEHTSAKILAATDSAVRTLLELMDEGKSEKVRLEAAIAVLDRAGIGPTSHLTVDLGAGDAAAAEVRARLERMAPNASRIIDGEVVDEQTD